MERLQNAHGSSCAKLNAHGAGIGAMTSISILRCISLIAPRARDSRASIVKGDEGAFHSGELCLKFGVELPLLRLGMLIERILALAAAAVVAVALGVGLTMMAFAPPRPNGAPALAPAEAVTAPLDEVNARQTVEMILAETPEVARYFTRLRETFTGDYESALSEFATRLSQTRQAQSVDYYLSEAVRRLRQARGELAAKAEPEAMARVFARQLDVLQAVARDDKKMCVAFLYGANNLDFQRFSAAQRPLVAEMAVASLDAMANGRDKKLARGQPTDADFKALETALAARGLGKPEIDALLDGKSPDPPLEDAKMCAAGQAYLEVLKTLPEAARARIYGLALELMAKS
jgi:hypothetical protein